MNATQNLLRKILPASFLGLSLSSCAVLALLFAVSFSDVLLQVACEECFGVSPEGILVVNGTEGRTVEESVSPGLRRAHERALVRAHEPAARRKPAFEPGRKRIGGHA